MKSELKIEFSNTIILKELIEKSYFEDNNGKLRGKQPLNITREVDDILYTVINNIAPATIKVTNEDLIDGTMRFCVEENEGQTTIIPASIYCIPVEGGKYSFY